MKQTLIQKLLNNIVSIILIATPLVGLYVKVSMIETKIDTYITLQRITIDKQDVKIIAMDNRLMSCCDIANNAKTTLENLKPYIK